VNGYQKTMIQVLVETSSVNLKINIKIILVVNINELSPSWAVLFVIFGQLDALCLDVQSWRAVAIKAFLKPFHWSPNQQLKHSSKKEEDIQLIVVAVVIRDNRGDPKVSIGMGDSFDCAVGIQIFVL